MAPSGRRETGRVGVPSDDEVKESPRAVFMRWRASRCLLMALLLDAADDMMYDERQS